jgi:FtsP/CotA-like multicopper oxidase with cupredoxin domain
MPPKRIVQNETDLISRRLLLKRTGALGLLAAVEHLIPACAWTEATSHVGSQTPLSGDAIDLTISEQLFRVDDRTGTAITINGTIPGPVIRLKEGQQATLRVTNRLTEPTSIHWHGLLLPPEMDGVPGSASAASRRAPPLPIAFPSNRAAHTGFIVTPAVRSFWGCTRR